MIESTKTFEEQTAENVNRFSALDLTEMTDRDISTGERKLQRAETPVEVKATGENNLIRWWRVESGGKIYHVRRLENFVYCSCPDFFYSRTEDAAGNTKATLCKHLAVTLKHYCRRCEKRDVEFGSLCEQCRADTAPYLKSQAAEPRRERIGGILV